MTSKNTPVMTRGQKASLNDSVSLDDIRDLVSGLISDAEGRLRQFFKEEIKTVTARLDKIESHLSQVQTECVRLDAEVATIKNVIVSQQFQIEANERKLREKNIIISNIPEGDLSTNTELLKNDRDKISFLIISEQLEVSPNDIESTQRVGKSITGNNSKPRPLKVTFKNKDTKFIFLNKRKEISTSNNLLKSFHQRVYINSDCSFLVQKEEFRLREKLRRIKSESPNSKSYLRSGLLYLDGSVVDRVDVKNQMF